MDEDAPDDQNPSSRLKGSLKRKKRKFGNKPKEAPEEAQNVAKAAPLTGPKYTFLHLAALILSDEIPILFPGNQRPRNAFAKIGSGGTFLVYAEPRSMADVIIEPHQLRSLAENMVLKRTRPRPSVNVAGHEEDARYAAIMAELRVLRDQEISEHENFIDLMGLTWDFEQGPDGLSTAWPVLVLEAATATLEDLMLQLLEAPLAEKIRYCVDVARALGFLHAKGVAHCDVKSENVLACVTELSGSVAKISDFGSAILDVTQDTDLRYGISGTRPWNAPEYGARLVGLSVFKTDVFSYGMLLWRSLVPNGFLGEVTGASDSEYEAALLRAEALKKENELLPKALEEMYRAYPGEDGLQHIATVFRKSLHRDPVERDTMASILQDLQSYMLQSSECESDGDKDVLNASPHSEALSANSDAREIPSSPAESSQTTSRISLLPETPFYNDFEDIFYCFQDESAAVKRQLVNALRSFAEDEKNPQQERAEAALQLSFSCYNGFGISRNLTEGYRWIVKAACLGNIKARAWAFSLSRAVTQTHVSLVPDQATLVEWLYDATKVGLFDPASELHSVAPDAFEKAMNDLRLAFCFGEDLSEVPIRGERDLIAICQGKSADALRLSPDGYRALHVAAALGYQDTVERLIAEGVDIHIQSDKGETALFCACRAGFLSIALYLLDLGPKPLTTNSGESPLHWLVSFEGKDVRRIATALISNGASLEPEDDGTPLAWAVSKTHMEAVKVLVELGADPFNHGGKESPIITAVSAHAFDMVAALLESRLASREAVAKPDSDGKTLLFHAIYCHEFFHRLRRHGAGIMDAARRTIALLLDSGCDPASVDEGGFSILHLAAGYCDREFLSMLFDSFDLERFINKPCGTPPYTPIFQAISSQRIETVQLFVAMKADTLYVVEGQTILHLLASINDEEYAMQCLALLNLRERPDINSLDKGEEAPQGITAYESALISGHLRVADMLVRCGADAVGPPGRKPHFLSLLICEQSWSSPDALRLYLQHVKPPFIVGGGDLSVLHVAASRAHIQADEETAAAKLDILLARFHRSEEINAVTTVKDGSDVHGQTPLHLAARLGSYFAVRRLLEYGADPKILDNRGRTPLDDAKAVLEYTQERILPHEMPRLMSNFKDTIELLEAVRKGLQWPIMRKRQEKITGETARARFSTLGFKTEH